MNIRRQAGLLLTALPRAAHRHGFGVQSPWAYLLVRDVLFERLHYYAYIDQQLLTPQQQQRYRIRLHFRHQPLTVITATGADAQQQYEQTASSATADTVLVVEHADDANADLWRQIVADPRAIVTFDMGYRGMVVFDTKRIKQNYLL